MKIENGIKMYFHCKSCINNFGYDKIAVGWTIKGLQVWCDKCDSHVIALDFQGNKVAEDAEPNKPVEDE